ncbi:MAG TPA: hypothetical protein PK965_04700, partial [Anaerohalosphaeraceae bacterium]|nr:hypothetical protein [Anaerohalosphaeraceae bacterium]
MRFAVMTAMLSAAALGATWTVAPDGTGDFTSIQEAIDASWDGDTILVYPGEYREDIYFNSRAVLLTSIDPNDPAVVRSTIIRGTVTFDFFEGPDSVLSGFTILPARQGNLPANDNGSLDVCTAEGTQESPAISGDIVVWADWRNGNCDIYGKNISTGEEFAVCTAQGDQTAPAINGNIVVWQDYRSG